MKRKFILSFFMIMICAGLIFLVRGFQEKAAVIPQPQQQASAVQDTADKAAGTAVSEAAAADTGSSGAAAGEKPVTSEKSTGTAATAPAADNPPDKGSSSSTAGSGTAAPVKAPATAPVETKQKASTNFTVCDSVSGTSLASKAVVISDGESVAAVTMEALDGDCRATGSGDSIYFSRIMGISEKSAGPMSGWCFYVNGQKPGLSAGSYKLKAGDVVEWKFLKDGTNN